MMIQRILSVVSLVFFLATYQTPVYPFDSFSLIVHHPYCDSIHKSRSNECVAAMHRACNQDGYGTGFSQEVSGTGIGVACFNNDWYGEININELVNRHGECNNVAKAQDPACMASIHRACNARGFAAGLAQELGSVTVGVACFSTRWYGDVHINELRSRHPDCNGVHLSQTPACIAATHRACNARGYGAGIPQEVGADGFGIACFDPAWYGTISIL